MPEGDTIWRTADALRRALEGKATVSVRLPRIVAPLPAAGEVVERVGSHGKHLEIGWSGGVVLHTHMMMTGSWHLYRPGERWRKPAAQMRAVIEVADWVAVCFNAPVVETYRPGSGRPSPTAGLGPDLCRPDASLDECVARLLAYPDPAAPIGEVLLDQRVACGVGNVYRAEVLFACGTTPFARVASIDEAHASHLISTAAKMLRANLGGPGRITVDDVPGGLAVYGRAGKPCFRCGTAISSRRLGEQQRVVFWCPTCQPAP